MKYLKKTRLAILLSAILILSLTTAYVLGSDTPFAPGPDQEYSGDGVPSGNPEIRPEAPGKGHAPQSGDGVPDGSGF